MDSDQHLKEALEEVQPQGELIVELKRNLNRKARRAKLTIRFTSLTIKAPQNRPWPKHLSAINLQVILAVEEEPPLSEEPISWLLLTNLPISNCSQAIRYVKWYSYRWLIERYHYTLKSGCGLEKLQLRSDAARSWGGSAVLGVPPDGVTNSLKSFTGCGVWGDGCREPTPNPSQEGKDQELAELRRDG
ncbi:transposase [Moorena sp. SIO4G3]|uniref:transposase n=1 Tax=Moorena sp. SIO4G3 TaxID=2607821 RepID=UPI00142D0059|nr:transposase [Moorena sp. SIO4G3]NEO80155.1 transposase [Moorena sp. SIO4G3]